MPSSAAADAALPTSPLGRLRLLVALDAFLVAGSVSGAAEALEISPPAASRLLAQLRVMFDDELLERRGRQMVPTALAQTLRLQVRAVATQSEALLAGQHLPTTLASPNTEETARRPLLALEHSSPALTVAPVTELDGAPPSRQLLARLRSPETSAPPAERLAQYIAIIGASGQPLSRGLDLREAEDAFSIVLRGEAEALQVGAFMGILSYRTPTSIELAGLVRAARKLASTREEPGAQLDWPAYLSPYNRNPPWFLLSAKLLAEAGYKICLHGFGANISPLEPVLHALCLPVASSLEGARSLIERRGVAYLHLTALHPQLQALVNLYPQVQMRLPVHLALQLLNPLSAPSVMMGLPKGSLPNLQREALQLVADWRLLTLDSHRDVAQATPHRLMSLVLSQRSERLEVTLPAEMARRAPPAPANYTTAQYCAAVWAGELQSPEVDAAIIDTAAMALLAMGSHSKPFDILRQEAALLWKARRRHLKAA